MLHPLRSLRRFIVLAAFVAALFSPSGRSMLLAVWDAARDVTPAASQPASAGTANQDDASTSPRRYHVKPGDSLWKIARTYNTTIEKIVRENPELAARAVLRAGMWIVLP